MMKNNWYKSAYLFLCVLLGISSAYSLPKGLSVNSSTATEISFSYAPDQQLEFLEKENIDDNTVAYRQTFLIGLPSNAEASVLSVERIGAKAVNRSLVNKEISLAVTSPIEISKPFMVRGLKLISVRVYPVTGNTMFDSVNVKIGFNGALRNERETLSGDGRFDRIFNASVINYDQARYWKKSSRSTALDVDTVASNFQKSDQWVKFPVRNSGFYKITGSQLQNTGMFTGSIESDSIRMFSGGGSKLSESNEVGQADLQEISISIFDGGDGQISGSDYIMFFGEALNRFDYDSTSVFWREHPYAFDNIYWLAYGGSFSTTPLRIIEMSASPDSIADTVINDFEANVHVEQNRILSKAPDNHIKDYYRWFWSDETNLSLSAITPNYISPSTAQISLKGNTGIGTGGVSYMNLNVNLQQAFNKNCNSRFCTFETNALQENGLNSFGISLGPLSTSVEPFFDYLEISYRSTITPINNELDFSVNASNSMAHFNVENSFSSSPEIYDISDRMNPVKLTNYNESPSTIIFQDRIGLAGINRYWLAPDSETRSIGSITPVVIEDLWNEPSSVDLIIITSSNLASSLDDYIAYRSGQGYSIKRVVIDDIVNSFGFGITDPTAIRNYLKYAYENYPQPAPSAVLFVGDGSYDFLGNLGSITPNIVMPYIRESDSAYSDDAYVHFGKIGLLDSDTSYVSTPDRGFDMTTSRWPVRTVNQVRTITEKIMAYESSSDFGSWRTRIALVADDQYGSGTSTETFHTTQTEDLEKNHIPSEFTRDKIYLWEFPLVNREKPQVNDIIVDRFNDGALIMNYVGHGNPDVWAHEHVFVRSVDLPRLNNRSKLPLVFAASCDISHFDDPVREGMGETLLSMSQGGAIGSVAATRLVYSSSNAAFNREAFDVLLTNDSLSIAEAVYTAKLLRQFPGQIRQTNDQKYIYLGGPFVELAIPKYNVVYDLPLVDTLVALDRVVVKGHIEDANGDSVKTGGTLLVDVFDSDRDKVFELYNNGTLTASIPYKVSGPTIYRGPVTIDNNGTFNFEFIVPLDVSFGGNDARILSYANLGNADAFGQLDSLVISDSIVQFTDSTGPEIQVSLNGLTPVVESIQATVSDSLHIMLTDSSGISLADHLGHGITLEINGNSTNQVNLTSQFAYIQDNVQTGSLSFSLNNLTPGEHQFRIRAWDNANNLSVADLNVTISDNLNFSIADLLNYPNPMQDLTTFYFELNQPVDQFNLEIFTTSGRLIRTISEYNLPRGQYPTSQFPFEWNGFDQDGDRVATGVYLYKASAFPQSGGETAEMFGKLVVINQ